MKPGTARTEPRLEETKRIARVLRLLHLLQSQPGQWTRAALAGEFEISERMLDNDLQLLRHGLGCTLRRSHAGYVMDSGPAVHALRLSVPEALALALAAQHVRDARIIDAAPLASALTCIEEALPSAIVPYLRRAGLALAPSIQGPVRSHGGIVAILERAIVERRKIRMTYSSASRANAITERVVAPYRLMPYERSFQLIGQDERRHAIRMFKVDRIQRCETMHDTFVEPSDFDVDKYLGDTWGVLRGEASAAEEVVLWFSARAAAWVRDEQWHSSQRIEVLADGGLVMRFHCAVTNELMRWVLSFGAHVRVEGPAMLRAWLVQEATRLLAMNAMPSEGSSDEI